MDIKGAYLTGTLNEEIYMKQPKGCEDGTGRVCRLNHTLYGLKRSGRKWNKTLKSFLIDVAGVQMDIPLAQTSPTVLEEYFWLPPVTG
ncbi:hypothetical protein K3495_g12895 [Podosphaera aphanis]|nr:hypothetical protein K3495_g12895 [Podosphaera aphanis]